MTPARRSVPPGDAPPRSPHRPRRDPVSMLEALDSNSSFDGHAVLVDDDVRAA